MLAFSWFALATARAESAPWSERIANSLIHSQGEAATTWDAETSFQLEGLQAEWYNTANGEYYRHTKAIVDAVLGAHSESGFANQPADATGQLGRQLLLFYRVTLHENYYQAAVQLRGQLSAVCRITVPEVQPVHAGDEPSKHICTAEPFLSEFASVFDKPQDFDAITKGFLFWEQQNHRQVNGSSEHRSSPVGAGEAELAAALVDSLEYYPPNDPGRSQLVAILNRIASEAGQRVGVEGAPGTGKTESPFARSLYVYALLKGVRLGYLSPRFVAVGESAWNALLKDSVHADANGTISMIDGPDGLQTPVAATGSSQHEDKFSRLGPLLLAATEVDLAPTATDARGLTVVVDSWFNSQQRKNAAGQMEFFHYKWSDSSDSGYSLLGHMFRSHGASLETLTSAPTQDRLRSAQFYVIVSPDIPVKNPNPHYMTERDAAEIASWVQGGGVLILMENDPPNADITHLNLLSDRFGIHFDDVLKHHIIGEQVEDGTIHVAAGGPVFRRAHTLYMKDTCAISVRDKAAALLRDRGDVVMAMAKYGRGTVFATVDPWLYNEYTDGRRNPAIYGQFDNFAGGQEVVRWLLGQRPAGSSGTRKNVEK
jgi:unsaturated rhamnogalacturonyl hydrolase